MTFPAISMAMPPISPLTSLTAFFFSWAISFSALFFRAAACSEASFTIFSLCSVAVFLALSRISLAFALASCIFCSYSSLMALASFFAASASVISASAAARRFSSISLIGLKRNRLIRYIWIKRLQICAIKVQGTIPTSS